MTAPDRRLRLAVRVVEAALDQPNPTPLLKAALDAYLNAVASPLRSRNAIAGDEDDTTDDAA